MNIEQLIDQFELITDTEEGIQQFKSLILNLAFRGKLVRRDFDTQSGKELLEIIKKDKQLMYDNGEIRKPKELSEIDIDEMPFSLPKRWTWSRLGDVYHNWGNKTPDKDFKYVDVSSIDNEKGEIGSNVEVISPENAPSRAKRVIKEGTVLYSTVRPYLLNVAIYQGNFDYEPIASTAFEVIHPMNGVFNRYIYNYLRSPIFTEYVDSTMVGVAYPAVNKGDMIEGYFPLPPLKEQQRIVQKIEALFTQVDELEQKVEQDRQVEKRLQVAILDDLQRAETPEASKQSWQRLTDQFEQIYRKPEHIDQLKQAILNEAVRGRLVPQDPDDEPAEQLLERINQEKQRLYDEGEIRKPKELPEIAEKEIPYELPEGWEWARMGDSLLKITDGTHKSPNNGSKGDYKYVTAKNIKEFGIQLDNITYVDKAAHEKIYSRCNPEFGDLLYIKDGATTGIATINDLEEPFSMLSSVALLKTSEEIFNGYLLYALRSPFFYNQMRDEMQGAAITRVTLSKLNKAILPIPPINEQYKIAYETERLVEWCDDLKEKLSHSQQIDRRLLEAFVYQTTEDSLPNTEMRGVMETAN